MSVMCRKCGHRNADGAQFCGNKECGAYLVWEGQQTHSAPDPTGFRQNRGLRVQMGDQTLAVNPGETCAVTVTLFNTGTRVEGVRVVVGGPASAWSTVEPTELSLYPEKTSTCSVRFSPPRGPQCPAGIMGFVVQCASQVHSGLVATASGTVSVGAFHELSAQLTPQVSRGRRRTSHQVRLENRGNVPERVRVTASDAEGALMFDPTDTTAEVAPGTLDLPMTVKAPWHWFGRTRTVPIQTVVVPLGGTPPLRVDGTRYVVALLPAWLLTAALALGVLGGGTAAALQLAGSDSPLSSSSAQQPTTGQGQSTVTSAPQVTTTTAPPTTATTPSSGPPTTSTTTTTVPVAAEPPGFAGEDCIGYNPGALSVANAGAIGFQLLEGPSHAMLLLDNEADARNALALAKRHKSMCFLGRNNKRTNRADYISYYWRGNSGTQTTISSENCVSHDPATLQVVNAGAIGFRLAAGARQLLLLDNSEDAKHALTWAKTFTRLCAIGAGNQRPDKSKYVVQYWLTGTQAAGTTGVTVAPTRPS